MLMPVWPEAWEAGSIIGRQRQDKGAVHSVVALGQASGTLNPAEDLFDAFAAALADVVAAVTSGTRVDRRLAPRKCQKCCVRAPL